MDSFPPKFYNPEERNEFHQIFPEEQYALYLTPWTVQLILYEMIQNHLLANTPQACGFPFKHTYTVDPVTTNIWLNIGHVWGKGNTPGARPAAFVFRDAVQYSNPIIGQITRVNPQESEESRLFFRGMNCSIAVIGKTVGFVEQLADYIKIPLVSFGLEIKRAFKFREFKITGISPPQPYKEALDNFIIIIQIATAFDEGTTIRRDDLKLKTVNIVFEVFEKCLSFGRIKSI